MGYEFSAVELREADGPRVLQLQTRCQICGQKSFSADKKRDLYTIMRAIKMCTSQSSYEINLAGDLKLSKHASHQPECS